MSAIETIERVISTNLIHTNFKYCLVDSGKRPYKIDGTMAAVNCFSDFVDFDELLTADLEKYAGIGISVQASDISAVDIDKCVKEPFQLSSINQFALEIIEMFKSFAYIEFSFSGTGIRILFKQTPIEDYVKYYKIKNSDLQLEFYQPNHSNRYVTVTGRYIYNNPILETNQEKLVIAFLDKYMKRKKILNKCESNVKDDKPIEELMKLVRYHLFKHYNFQDLWFTHAPGAGKDESERDYRLIKYLYINITKDKDKIKELFEQSDFFKSKDKSHMFKWTNQEFRYFNYIYSNIAEE